MTARRLDAGDVVAPGTPVLELQEAGAREVRLAVAGRDLGGLAPGSTVTVTIGGERRPAEVRAVVARRDLRARTVDVLLALPPSAAALPGDLVEVALPSSRRAPGFVVPTTALAEGQRGLWSVYTVVTGADGPVAERRTVDVLALAGDRAFVQGSIAAGDRIVATGVHRLVPGQRVRPDDAPTVTEPAP